MPLWPLAREDERDGAIDAGNHLVKNRTTLVENERKSNPLLFELACDRGVAVSSPDLLVVSKRQVDIACG